MTRRQQRHRWIGCSTIVRPCSFRAKATGHVSFPGRYANKAARNSHSAVPTLTPSVLSRGPGTGQRGSIFVRFGGHQNFRLTTCLAVRRFSMRAMCFLHASKKLCTLLWWPFYEGTHILAQLPRYGYPPRCTTIYYAGRTEDKKRSPFRRLRT